jgi:hypothetical protein
MDFVSRSLIHSSSTELATVDVIEAFGRFLRLHTADGDASPATIRTYHSRAGQFVAWCQETGLFERLGEQDFGGQTCTLLRAGSS